MMMDFIFSSPHHLQVSLDPEHDNTNLKIGPKNTMEIAILNDDDPGTMMIMIMMMIIVVRIESKKAIDLFPMTTNQAG